MYYMYLLNKLKICFQSESHKNITKSKHSRKFFVSPVKFTEEHIQDFVNEPTTCDFVCGTLSHAQLFLFDLILYAPVNKFSVMLGQVFLG